MTAAEEIRQWCQSVSQRDENLFVRRLRECRFRDQEIVFILRAMGETCPTCRDADNRCQCWNDD